MTERARSLPQMLFGSAYERSWFRADTIAGLTVAAMLVPQAMAYAELGGLPPSAGFRAALVALPVYALLGTSRHLGVGPEPGTAVLAALTVGTLAAGDADRYLALMAALAGIVGLFALLGGLLGLGFIANFLSKPVLIGYITGVGLTLLSSQLAAFFGAEIDADNFFQRFAQFSTRLDTIDVPTLAVGASTLAIIIGLRRVWPTAPGALVGLALTSAVVAIFTLDVDLVGSIEAAVPTPDVPNITAADLRDLAGPAAGVLLIAYTDNILTARSIAVQNDYTVDPNRELVALGAMNAAAAFGGGFPMSSSASRSFVPASLGSRSQMSSVVSFFAVLVFLLAGRSLLAEIPRAALAAVVVAAAFAVIDVKGFRKLAAISFTEMGLAAITCLAILTTDLLFGVLVAVALSGLVTLHRVARPHDAILGEGEGLDGWIEVTDRRASTLPGLLVYRFDAPLFFGNAEHFRERVHDALRRNPTEERHVILDFEGIGSIDSTAAEHLVELHEELTEANISVAIARANSDVLEILARSGLAGLLGRNSIYPTINAAVRAYS
ncbi:MAG: SulP family inorganic anion transporter, partial [Acidimicrobiales bacterium]|nr:SulP family inorganic anion transporter [Acidimicrobiales bacterium]